MGKFFAAGIVAHRTVQQNHGIPDGDIPEQRQSGQRRSGGGYGKTKPLRHQPV